MSCIVKDCKSVRRFKPEGVSFHRLPVEEDKFKEWQATLGGRVASWASVKNKFICSRHFNESDFIKTPRSVHLKSSAVPLLFFGSLPATAQSPIPSTSYNISLESSLQPIASSSLSSSTSSKNSFRKHRGTKRLGVQLSSTSFTAGSSTKKQKRLVEHARLSSFLDLAELSKITEASNTAGAPLLSAEDSLSTVNQDHSYCSISGNSTVHSNVIHDRFITVSHATTESEIKKQNKAEEMAHSTKSLLRSDVAPTWELEVPKPRKMYQPTKQQQASLFQHMSSNVIHDNDDVSAVILVIKEDPLSTVGLHVITDELDDSVVQENISENTPSISVDNFDKICRICFSQEGLEPFFLLHVDEGIPLQEIYTKLTSLAAHEDDKLPGHICMECIKSVITMFEFVQKCEKSYKLLQEIVSNCDFNSLENSYTGEMLKEGNLNNFNVLHNYIDDNNKENSHLTVSANEDNQDIIEEFPDLILTSNDGYFQNNSNSSRMDFVEEEDTKEGLPFSCKPCQRAFSTAFELQVHILGSKQCRLKMYQCNVCKAGFSSPAKLEMHMKGHAIVKHYKCGICCQQYRNLGALKRHQNVHEKRAQQALLRKKIAQQSGSQHSCSVCNKVFTSFDDVKQHMESSDVHCATSSSSQRHNLYNCPKSGGTEDSTKQWYCSQCPKGFQYKSMLYYHEQNHTEGKGNGTSTYLCTICGKLLQNSKGYRTHMKSHSEPSKKLICNVCKKEFASRAGLTIHMNSHNRIKSHLCSTCGKTFVEKHHLFQHMRSHVDLKPFFCHICNKKFRESVNLRQHLQVCTKIKSLLSEQGPPFSCTQCAAAFDTVTELQVHITENRKCIPKMHQCDLCKTKFSSAAKLKMHMRVHSKIKPYQCDICGEQFRYLGNVSRHKKIHENKAQQRLLREKIAQQSENLQLCRVCNEVFASSDDLKQHMESHACEKCGMGSASSTSLQKHKYCCPANGRNGNIKQWLCSRCPKSFRYKSRLYFHEQDHVEGKDTDVSPDLCTVCGKLFKNRSAFYTHMKSHGGATCKKVVCKVCNKEFANSASIYLHMKIHNGIRRHVCSICGKAFVQKPHLLTHYNVHADLKPFSCQICDKKFREKGNLTQHLRFCTGVTPFRCSVCHKGLTSSTSLKKHMDTHAK